MNKAEFLCFGQLKNRKLQHKNYIADVLPKSFKINHNIKITMKKFGLILSLVILSFAFMNMIPKGDGYKIGDTAMDFKLKNIDNKTISLADMPDAKGFVIVFTCNHCPFAKKYEDRLIALHHKYASQGYPIVAINPNDPKAYPEDSFKNMQQRAKEKGFPFVYLHDDSQKVAKTYGALKTPQVYLVNKEAGALKVAYMGGIDDNPKDANAVTKKYLGDAIDALLEGKKPTINTTKAVGCSIKWKK